MRYDNESVRQRQQLALRTAAGAGACDRPWSRDDTLLAVVPAVPVSDQIESTCLLCSERLSSGVCTERGGGGAEQS